MILNAKIHYIKLANGAEVKMESEDYFFEYFYQRPVQLAFLLIFGTLISAVGLIGNVLILVIKWRRGSDRSGLEFFIINLTMMFAITTVLVLVHLLEESNFGLMTDRLCDYKVFLTEFTSASILCSLIGLIIVTRFFPKISRKQAIIVLVIIWIAAVLDAYPYYSSEAVDVFLDDEKSRRICSIAHIVSEETYSEYKRHKVFMNIIEFGIPALLFVLSTRSVFS
jgi:hypothetical protein